MSSDLTATVAGICGVVLGVGLKALTDWLLERTKRKSEYHSRFRDERREMYTAFVKATLELGAELRYPAAHLESVATPSHIIDALHLPATLEEMNRIRERFLYEFGRVRFHGSKFPSEAAVKIFEAIERDDSEAVGHELMMFLIAVREDLKIPD